jgi:hypothetical protein
VNRRQRRAHKVPAGEQAQSVLITTAEVNAGPPAPFMRWDFHSIRALLRKKGIDVETIVNWCRAPDGLGFLVYYYGEEATAVKAARIVH